MDKKIERTIIRTNKRENPYVMIDKCGLNDERLSWKAKGLLTYLLSKPDDWEIYEVDLIKHATDGRDSVRTCLRELERFGYLSRRQTLHCCFILRITVILGYLQKMCKRKLTSSNVMNTILYGFSFFPVWTYSFVRHPYLW